MQAAGRTMGQQLRQRTLEEFELENQSRPVENYEWSRDRLLFSGQN